MAREGSNQSWWKSVEATLVSRVLEAMAGMLVFDEKQERLER